MMMQGSVFYHSQAFIWRLLQFSLLHNVLAIAGRALEEE